MIGLEGGKVKAGKGEKGRIHELVGGVGGWRD